MKVSFDTVQSIISAVSNKSTNLSKLSRKELQNAAYTLSSEINKIDGDMPKPTQSKHFKSHYGWSLGVNTLVSKAGWINILEALATFWTDKNEFDQEFNNRKSKFVKKPATRKTTKTKTVVDTKTATVVNPQTAIDNKDWASLSNCKLKDLKSWVYKFTGVPTTKALKPILKKYNCTKVKLTTKAGWVVVIEALLFQTETMTKPTTSPTKTEVVQSTTTSPTSVVTTEQPNQDFDYLDVWNTCKKALRAEIYNFNKTRPEEVNRLYTELDEAVETSEAAYNEFLYNNALDHYMTKTTEEVEAETTTAPLTQTRTMTYMIDCALADAIGISKDCYSTYSREEILSVLSNIDTDYSDMKPKGWWFHLDSVTKASNSFSVVCEFASANNYDDWVKQSDYHRAMLAS